MSSEIAPDSWAITDEDWSPALGLPPRPEGWGLVMFHDEDRRWTWAVDPVMVTTLDERDGDLSNFDRTSPRGRRLAPDRSAPKRPTVDDLAVPKGARLKRHHRPHAPQSSVPPRPCGALSLARAGHAQIKPSRRQTETH